MYKVNGRKVEHVHHFDILVVCQDGEKRCYAHDGTVKTLRALCVRVYRMHNARLVEVCEPATRRRMTFTF